MTPGPTGEQGRLIELLADEATADLDRNETQELDALLDESSEMTRDDMMQVAAQVQLGFLKSDKTGYQRMPEHLRAAVHLQATEFFAQRAAANESPSVSSLSAARQRREGRRTGNRWRQPAALGWYLAAALALAFVIYRTDTEVPVAPSIAEQRQATLAEADAIQVPWAPSDQPGFTGVTGDVVWSNSRQAGFLRLAGLPVNAASQMQYQLWIVDPERDANPVDGGVFDVPADSGELIVPIDAKLTILSPRAFAITAEQPGGVVVSDGPLLVVASVAG